METLLLFVAALVTSTISGIVGMAGGILLLGAMTLFLPFSTLIPIHGLVQFSSNFTRAAILRKNVALPQFIPFLMGVVPGGFLGYLLLSKISSPEWMLIFVAVLLLYVIFKPKKFPELSLGTRGFFLLGVSAAILGCLVGATGPLLAPFMIRRDFSKENIVATKAACQLMVHLVKVPIFLALAFNYFAHSWLIFWMIIGVVIGTRLGTHLLKKINGKQFMVYVKIAMGIMALRLIYKLMDLYIF